MSACWQDLAPPTQDATTATWWDATRERRLVLQTCQSCAAVQHPPRSVCLACLSEELGWTEASGAAVVDSFTVVHRAPRPDVVAPYVLARVRLAEGPVLLTRIEDVDPTAEVPVRCDQSVSLRWAELADGRALPVFVPDHADTTTQALEH